jgi:subtilase family serine protease
VVNGTAYYYVVAATNAVGTGPDSAEASATPNQPSDLVVSSLTAPNNAGAGTTITVVVTTTNQGGGVAGASTTRIYLSDKSRFGTNDVLLQPAQALPPLAPGASSSASLSVTLPPDTPVGARYLVAVGVADQQVGESREVNNGRARWMTIGPDLLVTGLDAPLVAAAGESIQISDTVKNQGGGAAAASGTTFYLSTDFSLDAADTPLPATRPVPALDAGASSSGGVTVTLPATIGVGQWYLIAKADGGSAVPEAYEGNNTYGRSIRIGADLLVSSFSAPVKGGAGLAIPVTDTTLNQGTGSTAAAITRFYLSADTQRDAGDSELGARVVPPLGAGASSTATTTVSIPAGTPTGAYYLLAVADADNTVVETYETNNLWARTILIGGDLTVSTITAPASAGAGASIVVGDTTANQGGGAVGATTTRYYFSTNNVLDAQDVVLGARAVPALAAGTSHSGSATVTIPAGSPLGTYYIIARADGDEAVAEAAESNNTLTRTILLGGDLIISSYSVPAKGGAGLPLVVSDTTLNAGATGVPASTTRFYLSANAILDAGDTPLQGSRAVPALAPGAASSGSTTLTIPPSVGVGWIYVIATADADDAAAETQESNNSLARLVTFGPDLTITALTPPTRAAAGSTISVSETTTNLGGGTAAAATTTFALSADTTLTAGDIVLGGSHAMAALPPGTSSAAVTSLTIPAGVAPGVYYLFANADASGAVVETLESNNTRWHIVGIGPDMVVSMASASSGAVQIGSTVTVTETAANQGAAPAAPSTMHFYLSQNMLVDGSDVLLPASRAVPALAGGAASSGTTVITIPPGTPLGTHLLLAVADGASEVAESYENNNARFVRAIQVTAP